MNKHQLIKFLEGCPEEFEIYVDDGTSDYDIQRVEVDFDDGVLLLCVAGDPEEDVDEEEEDSLWNTPDPGLAPVCGIENTPSANSPNLVEV